MYGMIHKAIRIMGHTLGRTVGRAMGDQSGRGMLALREGFAPAGLVGARARGGKAAILPSCRSDRAARLVSIPQPIAAAGLSGHLLRAPVA